jgi:hypothetical protein
MASSHNTGPTYRTAPSKKSLPAVHAQNAPSAPQYAPYVPPTPVAAQPYDPNLEQQRLTAGRNVALGNNEATWQTQNTGYDLGYNPDGTSNAANPYSQAQLLQDSYHRQQLGTTNSMAAQGQLYSGALSNAQATNDRGYSQGDAALRQQALERYHSIGATRAANYASNASGMSDAEWQALLKATYGG